jgi:hypothetical protein
LKVVKNAAQKKPQVTTKETSKPKKTENVKQIPVENPVIETVSEPLVTAEMPHKSPKKDKVKEKSSKDIPKKTEEIPKKSKEMPEKVVKIPSPEPDIVKTPEISETNVNLKCADLVFDSVYVVKQKKNTLLLHFILVNNGNAPASLLGQTKEKEDNLAVNVYMTSGLKLTRGSFLLDGIFFKDKETEAGLLLPGKRLEGEIEVSTENRTRFTPNLVFELDPFQTVQECNRTNNTKGLIVR